VLASDPDIQKLVICSVATSSSSHVRRSGTVWLLGCLDRRIQPLPTRLGPASDERAVPEVADGDAWLRIHARLGATLLRPEPESLQIEATVADWERWTEMTFPEDGEYVFPSRLATLSVRDGLTTYWEPNVWMLHDL
jgi:hypothetical protein